MHKKPKKIKWYLKPLTYLLSSGDVKAHDVHITKTNMEGIEPPFLLLCNHNAFLDFKVATMALWPVTPNYVIAIDGFIGREKLLRNIGSIGKRKFTNDISLIKNLKYVIDNGGVPAIYPEARYSLCGTNAVLPESLGKLCRYLGVPVVTLMCHGHHINSPFWNTKDKFIKGLEAELSLLFTKEDIKTMTPEELNAKINERFVYNDYEWALSKNIKITAKDRAEGLSKVLYQCPVCGKEYRMKSEGAELYCESCKAKWQMKTDGSLEREDGENIFTSIPDWYEWERSNVRKEVEEGTYNSGELKVLIRSLPNADKFINLGSGTLVHDMKGFHVRGKDLKGGDISMEKDVPSLYSCHIEYEYLGKYGDCVDLNTLTDTWYIYPYGRDFSVTKMALATEELFFDNRRRNFKEKKAAVSE